jgi:SAM-dependent methyltransferase
MLAAIKSRLPEKYKIILKRFIKKITNNKALDREALSYQYLKGNGIEIGALHNPLKVSSKAHVKYLDRYDYTGLNAHYPELKRSFVKVDIIDDGELLGAVADGSQDFVIANHFLEHCKNPLLTLSHMYRVLKKNGILYLALPDKRFTFDAKRPITPLEHLLQDYHTGPEFSKLQHYEEWVRLVDGIEDTACAAKRTKELMEQDYSIHFHVWTQREIMEMILHLKQLFGIQFDLEVCLKHGVEFITVLRKEE